MAGVCYRLLDGEEDAAVFRQGEEASCSKPHSSQGACCVLDTALSKQS